jgi:hypothetical protein
MAFFQEIKEQIGNLQPSRKDLRNLGLVFFIALGIIGSLLWWKGRSSAPWFWAAALVLGIWGWVWPSGLKPIYRVWMGLAVVLNYFISRFILILLYYLVLTPTGLVLRVLGRDILDLKLKDRPSYWHRRSSSDSPGEQQATYSEIKQGSGKIALMVQFWVFLRARKKFWLLPIVLMLVLLGALIIFGEGSALAPFIYTLF